MAAQGRLDSVKFPANMFADIKHKERLRLEAGKQMKSPAFSRIFSRIYNWTWATYGFVNVDDLWLEHIEPLILVRQS